MLQKKRKKGAERRDPGKRRWHEDGRAIYMYMHPRIRRYGGDWYRYLATRSPSTRACKPERPPEGLALQRGRTAILGVPEVAVPQARRWAPKRWRCSAWQCGRGAGDSDVAGTRASTQRCSQGTGGRDHDADPAAHNKPLEGRSAPVHTPTAGTGTRDSPSQPRGRVGGSNRRQNALECSTMG